MNKRPKKISKHRAFARLISESAFRNPLEGLHDKITESEMRTLMLEVEDKMIRMLKFYDFWKDDKNKIEKKTMCKIIKEQKFGASGISWDNPMLDEQKI